MPITILLFWLYDDDFDYTVLQIAKGNNESDDTFVVVGHVGCFSSGLRLATYV